MLSVLAPASAGSGQQADPSWQKARALVRAAVECEEATANHLLAAIRFLFGLLCEEAQAKSYPSFLPHLQRSVQDMQLRKDAALVAIWTSAHATSLVHIADAIDLDVDATPASLMCEVTEPCVEEAFCGRSIFTRKKCSSAHHLSALLQRCCSYSNRGWAAAAQHALKHCAVCRALFVSTTVTALSGLHSLVEPPQRAPWFDRLVLQQRARRCMQHESAKQCVPLLMLFKDCLSRAARTGAAGAVAELQALQYCSASSARASSAGLQAVERLMIARSTRAVVIGIEFCQKVQQDEASSPVAAMNVLTDLIDKHPVPGRRSEDRSRSQASSWDTSSSLRCKGGPLAVQGAVRVCELSFAKQFISVWAFASAVGTRASRVPKDQLLEMRASDGAMQLLMQLTADERLGVQRLALRFPDAGIMSRSDVWKLLGAQLSSSTRQRSVEATFSDFNEVGPFKTACYLAFCRVAALAETVLVYDLGAKVRSMQERALLRRLQQQTAPEHSTKVFVCLQCRRPASSLSHGGKHETQTFTEIGVGGTMLHWQSGGGGGSAVQFLCARRTSASYRNSRAHLHNMEHVATTLSEKQLETCCASVEQLLGGSADPRVVVRLRRDCSSAFTQSMKCTPCGKTAMASAYLVGKAVRIFGTLYSLCCFCGACTKVGPLNRYGAFVCCMHCDAAMLQVEKKSSDEEPPPKGESCRYCGKMQPARGATYKLVKSPMDVCGNNASLPPPLRKCYFCPAHFKAWIPQAMRVLPTRVILAHIACGAKPDIVCEKSGCGVAKAKKRKIPRGDASKKRQATHSAPVPR